MKIITQRFLTALIFASLPLSQAFAKPSDWYQVEVLFFAHADNPTLTERWRDIFSPDYSANPVTLLNAEQVSAKPPTETAANYEGGAFITLPPEELLLTATAQRIKSAPDFRLLSHLAWRQPIPRGEEALPVLIQTGEQFNKDFELEGTLSMRRGRYLHARTDLFFSRFEEMKPVEELDWTIFSGDDLQFGQRDWNPSFNDNAETGIQYVRATTANLKQSRRMRSGELHYIDHPLFGILIQVSPYSLRDPAMDLSPIPLTELPETRPLPDSAISPDL